MEKIKLNNQVVLMRKYVKQAKVHSINKLVKQVKLLQNRKGSEAQISKAKRKAERYLKEITIIKKIRPDYVSKLALSKAKDWKEVLLQKNSSLEDRCIAVLASYGPVQKEVEKFYNSNQNLVLKISDLIKQWEEKNKFPKDSSQNKKSDFKKLQDTGNLMSKMMYHFESTSNENSKSVDEKTNNSLLIDNSHELRKGNRKIKSVQNQKLSTSVKASQKSLPTGKVTEASHSNEYVEQNIMEIEECDKRANDEENELKSYIDSNAEIQTKNSSASGSESESNNESDMEENEDSENEDFRKSEPETNKQTKNDTSRGNRSEAKSESYAEENENSEDEDILDNELDTKSNNSVDTGFKRLQNFAVSDTENSSTTCTFPAKMEITGSKSDENKLKEIAVLNLEDFKDLDEIPVNNSVKNEETEEEEEDTDDDDSLNKASQDDPFFLSRDEAVSTGNSLIDDPKSIQYVSVNEIFERKEKSNNKFNSINNFQKTLNCSHFSGKYSSEQRTQNNFKIWKQDKFLPKSQQNKIQYKSKDNFGTEDAKRRFQPYKPRNFDKGDFKNRKDFNKRTFSDTYRNNRPSKNDVLHRSGDSSFKKSKLTSQKNDVDSKPLHPSWEAKRKQKNVINTSFKGKKIVFED